MVSIIKSIRIFLLVIVDVSAFLSVNNRVLKIFINFALGIYSHPISGGGVPHSDGYTVIVHSLNAIFKSVRKSYRVGFKGIKL